MKREMLEYYCDSIRELYSMNIFLFQKGSEDIDLSQLTLTENVSFAFDKGITDFYSAGNLFDTTKMVSYYISDDDIAFGCVSDMNSSYCLYIGPCMLSDLNQRLMNAMMNRYNSPFVHDPERYYDQLHSYLAKLPRLSQERFLMLLQFSNAFVNGVQLEVDRFHASSFSKKKLALDSKKRKISETKESFEMSGRIRNSLLALVKTGDRKRLNDYWDTLKGNNPLFDPDPSSKLDKMRQRKNSFIHLLSYIESQIKDPFISTRVLDEIHFRHVEKVENVVSVQQLEQICHDALFELTGLIANRQNQIMSDEPLIKKAVEYIHDHISEDLSSFDIAQALQISRGRLSNLFNKEMSCTLPDYIGKQKIEVAKTLLETTDMHIIDISSYLSFSSQSYFQNIFKKYSGMTPKQYRRLKDDQ
ncbi:MAG: AraC family transcriptional regulator [Erysipelotrichaceae bacterium]|nr:AraC family transcriptional regulator [Erysipelotrichaceae bacterium]